MRSLPAVVLFCAVLAPCAPSLAGTVKLDVKPGLWETTVAMDMSAMMPMIPDAQLAQMPPQQRAAMQSAMARASQPHTAKSCLTEDELKKGVNFDKDPNPSCKRNVVSNTSSDWQITEECTGEHPHSMKAHYQALNSENVVGQMDMSFTTRDGKTSQSKGTIKTKWLGSDCGDVKPHGE